MNIICENSILLASYAKINICLDILNKRKDNFHNLLTIIQKISLYDDLYITMTNNINQISIKSNNLDVPNNKNNLSYKAALLFFQYTNIKNKSVYIYIKKRIPICAGLGGGSSNAAYTIIGLNKLFNTKLKSIEMLNMSKKVGTDVPFFLKNNTAFASNLGTNLKEIKNFFLYYIVICVPNKKISTKNIFQNYKTNLIYKKMNYHEIIHAYKNNNYFKVLKYLHNALEPTTVNYCYEILKIKKFFYKLKCDFSSMSGSGSSVFGLYKNYFKALYAYNVLKKTYNKTFICYNM